MIERQTTRGVGSARDDRMPEAGGCALVASHLPAIEGIFVTLFIELAALTSLGSQQTSTVFEYEKEAGTARMVLSGHVTADVTTWKPQTDGTLELGRKSRFRIVFAGERKRQESVWGGGVNHKEIREVSLKDKDEIIVLHPGLPIDVSIYTPACTNWERAQARFVEVRPIGLNYGGFRHAGRIAVDELIKPEKRKSAVESSVGPELRRVDFDLEWSGGFIVYDLGKGANPVEISLQLESGDRYTVRSALEKFGKVWFPSRVETIQFDGNGTLVEKEEIVVAEADFTEPNDSEFALASLGMEVGQLVTRQATTERPQQEVLTWDGTRLNVLTLDELARRSGERRRNWPLIAGSALVLTGIIGLILIKFFGRAFKR